MAGPGAGEESFQRESLVRVSLRYETSGVFHEGKFLQSQVIETTDLQGVIVDARGYILSYAGSHWMKLGSSRSRLVIRFSDGKSESAQLVAVDERIEVALVETSGASGKEVGLGSDLGQKGLQIVGFVDGRWRKSAICPVDVKSNDLLPERTVIARSCGAKSQAPDAHDGSFLFDRKGRFLGVVTDVEEAGLSGDLRAYRVVPTETLNESVRKLVQNRENLHAGYLGIYPEPDSTKVVVSGVERNTPAADSGLIAGDVIVAVDSQPIQNLVEFGKILRWKGPGAQLELTLERGGGVRKVQPVLSSLPERRPVYGWKLELPRIWSDGSEDPQELKLSPMPLPSHLRFGLVVDTLSPQLASYFKVPDGTGLLVTTVMEESLASRSGFRAGDVLIEINGTRLSSPGVMREILQSGTEGAIVVKFFRDGHLLSRKLVFP